MNTLAKVSLLVCVFAVCFAYFVHVPVPDDCPDRTAFQILADVMSVNDLIAQLFARVMGNTWWTVPGRSFDGLLSVEQREGIEVSWITLGNVNTAIIKRTDFDELSESSPAVVYYHGGGWVFGTVDTYMPLLLDVAEKTGYVVMSPDYRRAPEFPFPVPYEDCLNSTLAFIQRAQEFNVDPEKIAIMGDSAGGNLAMAITNTLIEMNEIDHDVSAPKMQVLLYPILQMLDFRLPSYLFNQNPGILYPQLIAKMWLNYAGYNKQLHFSDMVTRNQHVDDTDNEIASKKNLVSRKLIPSEYTNLWSQSNPQTEQETIKSSGVIDDETREKIKQLVLDPRMAPLMLPDDALMKMARTHVMVCQYDPLRDDGIIVVERMKRLGNDVTIQYLPTSLHAASTLGAMVKESYHANQNSITFNEITTYINAL